MTAGRSFSHICSGVSNKPMVFPMDFDIFACPSSPTIRRVGVSFGCGSGKSGASGENRVFQFRAMTRESSRCWTWSSPTGTMSAR
ncbi:hypothetical protein D3C83_87710 [compost metagenome]